MSKSMPPVPPAGRSDKGPGSAPDANADDQMNDRPVPQNLEQTDRQGNTKQNTTHQGYQQNR